MPASKDYVKKYLWHDPGQPLHRQWQITLTNSEGLAFLAFVSALVAYTQTRAWKLACLAVKRITRPIQLCDEDDPQSLSHLSQRQAVSRLAAMLRSFLKRDRAVVYRNNPARNEMKSVSPWFGLVAIGNMVIFVILGVLIPWLLTGNLETPVVQSRTWHGCYRGVVDLNGKGEEEAYLAAHKYETCWFNASKIPGSCRRQDSIILDRPVMKVSRNISCPFMRTACEPDVRPIQLDHSNITLRDYGVNLNSRILHSRRLTCAPLRRKHFLTLNSDNTTWLMFAKTNASLTESGAYPSLHKPLSWAGKHGTLSENGDTPRLRQRLSYPDGRMPHPTGSDMSSWLEDSAPDVKSWSTTSGASQGHESHISTLHPDLDRMAGKTFVLVFKAGRLRHLQPIHDPMYSSHFKDSTEVYWPDYEYTAIGCIEQHRMCLSGLPGVCTPYATLERVTRHLANYLESSMDDKTSQELKAFEEVYRKSDTHEFVNARGINALLSSQPNIWNWREIHIDPVEQWTWDVKAWFESSFLLFRIYLFAIVTGNRFGAFLTTERTRTIICGYALFLDGDYTNINFIGLLITLVAIALICGCSIPRHVKVFMQYLERFFWEGLNANAAFWTSFRLSFPPSSRSISETISNTLYGEPSLAPTQGANLELDPATSREGLPV